MAETLLTLKTRRSCRAYKPELIEEEKLNAIIEAGTYAATGRGMQSPIIIAVTDRAVRDRLSKMNAAIMGASIDPFYGAPELLIVLASKERPTYIYDGSLVLGNMMNAAADLGVGSCWIHRAKEEFESEEGKALLKSLGIEGEYEGIGHLVLGYPAAPLADPAPRKENYVYRIQVTKQFWDCAKEYVNVYSKLPEEWKAEYPNTKKNRQMLVGLAKDVEFHMGKDKYGNHWHARNNNDGTQDWVRHWNQKIINGGRNVISRPWNKETGLNNNPLRRKK